jgi:hypothetical protein
MEVGSNFVALAGAQLIQDWLASKRKFKKEAAQCGIEHIGS